MRPPEIKNPKKDRLRGWRFFFLPNSFPYPGVAVPIFWDEEDGANGRETAGDRPVGRERRRR